MRRSNHDEIVAWCRLIFATVIFVGICLWSHCWLQNCLKQVNEGRTLEHRPHIHCLQRCQYSTITCTLSIPNTSWSSRQSCHEEVHRYIVVTAGMRARKRSPRVAAARFVLFPELCLIYDPAQEATDAGKGKIHIKLCCWHFESVEPSRKRSWGGKEEVSNMHELLFLKSEI